MNITVKAGGRANPTYEILGPAIPNRGGHPTYSRAGTGQGTGLTAASASTSYVNVINIHTATSDKEPRAEDMTTIANAEVKLDQWGMGAWIALMVLGFFIWWPLGLATLAYVIWSGRMSCWRRGEVGRWGLHSRDAARDPSGWFRPSSGNNAFDEYRTETLRRLEDEQREFKEFLERLRFARDKNEFDQFMAERRNSTAPSNTNPPTQS